MKKIEHLVAKILAGCPPPPRHTYMYTCQYVQCVEIYAVVSGRFPPTQFDVQTLKKTYFE